MMKLFNHITRYIKIAKFPALALGSLAMACTLLTSCVAEDLPGCMDGDDNAQGITGDNYVLRFKVSLPTMGKNGATRDFGPTYTPNFREEYEDYVDPAKLYIMFFLSSDDQGNPVEADSKSFIYRNGQKTDQKCCWRLFKIIRPGDKGFSMIPVAYDHSDEYDMNWYVNISIPELNGGTKLAQTLRECNFKIAVMANAEPGSTIDMLEPTYDPLGHITLGSDINRLHFQTTLSKDPYSKDDKPNAVYSFLWTDNGYNENGVLGHYTNWVTNNYNALDSKSKAYNWIRENWNPKGTTIYRDYSNLWEFWNFGGADNIDVSDEKDGDFTSSNYLKYPNFAKSWEERNGLVLRDWINDGLANSNKELEDLVTGSMTMTSSGNIVNATGEGVYGNFLEFRQTPDGATKAKALKKQSDVSNQYYYGVFLPQNPEGAGTIGGVYKKFPRAGKGCLIFRANATGTLYIYGNKAGTRSGTNSTKVIAQVGYSETKCEFQFTTTTPDRLEKKLQVTGDSQFVYIYADSNTNCDDAEIYSIEFVEDEYLNGTDRVGIAPSEEHPIPMYGVAYYGKLGDLWPEGTTFDLNNYNIISQDLPDANPPELTYFHPIPLLRSVAKVELLIPKALNPNHVFLRSVNRYGRWEPNDVESNTMDIWSDYTEDLQMVDGSYVHNEYCEWFNIMGHLPFYNPNNKDVAKETQVENYQKKLAWYYGNWGTSQKLDNVDYSDIETENTHNNFTYPHILNPLISRSDFVEFIDAGEVDGIYNRYVLYVGEKFVDDPDSNEMNGNMETASPKVCHIEFRTGSDPHYNLDDNNCYRIYFTENGFNSSYSPSGTPPDLSNDANSWEKAYEENTENLKKHWPIIRNHAYRFTVQDISSMVVIVQLEVLPWRKTQDISVSW